MTSSNKSEAAAAVPVATPYGKAVLRQRQRVHQHRTADTFRRNKSLSEPSHLSSAFCDGKGQLDVAKRQELASKLYAPKMTSIMDLKLKPIN